MQIGTKSVLYGAHCFFVHPWFVAAGWTKLYGFPVDPRLWASFFLHDIGYVGSPNMDGPEGEEHPIAGALIMKRLFGQEWGNFCVYHSRYFAKKRGIPVSRLCFADKLAFALTPRWLYLPMVRATGEIDEYMARARTARQTDHWDTNVETEEQWHDRLCKYMTEWVEIHKNGTEDTWTNGNRNAK